MKLKDAKNYLFPTLLLLAIVLGGFSGYALGPKAQYLKPAGDLFLNLLFTLVVPLVFFSVASATANMSETKKIGRVALSMVTVFLFTSLIAAIFMLVIVKLFPPGQGFISTQILSGNMKPLSMSEQWVSVITVSDFIKLFSRDNMLALILFSILIGLATAAAGDKGKPFLHFLQAGNTVFNKAIAFIMYYAPIGFFAYFAVLVSTYGSKLLGAYFNTVIIFYPAAITYFIVALSFYAYLSEKMQGVKLFWSHIFSTMMTALATCSSAASLPVNLAAAEKMGVPETIAKISIPLGTVLHKDGSVLGGLFKIAFLFTIFHLSFTSTTVFVTAIAIALLVGTVMGAIPSGGLMGEMLIVSLYGFPPQALLMIAVISIIIDPIATMLNVTCNTVCSMLIARLAYQTP